MVTKYPKEVLTKNGKEARKLMDRGRFARYRYINVKTGELSAKYKLVLTTDDGKCEEFFVVPMKNGSRYLLLPDKERVSRKLLDGDKVVDLY